MKILIIFHSSILENIQTNLLENSRETEEVISVETKNEERSKNMKQINNGEITEKIEKIEESVDISTKHKIYNESKDSFYDCVTTTKYEKAYEYYQNMLSISESNDIPVLYIYGVLLKNVLNNERYDFSILEKIGKDESNFTGVEESLRKILLLVQSNDLKKVNKQTKINIGKTINKYENCIYITKIDTILEKLSFNLYFRYNNLIVMFTHALNVKDNKGILKYLGELKKIVSLEEYEELVNQVEERKIFEESVIALIKRKSYIEIKYDFYHSVINKDYEKAYEYYQIMLSIPWCDNIFTKYMYGVLLKKVLNDEKYDFSILEEMGKDDFNSVEGSLKEKLLMIQSNDLKNFYNQIKINIENKKEKNFYVTLEDRMLETLGFELYDRYRNLMASFTNVLIDQSNNDIDKILEELKKIVSLEKYEDLVRQVEESNNKKNITTNDLELLGNILNTPLFNEMFYNLTYEERLIISLRFGFIKEKYYSLQEISEALEISLDDVSNTIRKILTLYKQNLSSLLDILIDVSINDENINLQLTKKEN